MAGPVDSWIGRSMDLYIAGSVDPGIYRLLVR